MLAPNTPDVSLNRILRDLFFERSKAPREIGPIYTATLIPRLAGEVHDGLVADAGRSARVRRDPPDDDGAADA